MCKWRKTKNTAPTCTVLSIKNFDCPVCMCCVWICVVYCIVEYKVEGFCAERNSHMCTYYSYLMNETAVSGNQTCSTRGLHLGVKSWICNLLCNVDTALCKVLTHQSSFWIPTRKRCCSKATWLLFVSIHQLPDTFQLTQYTLHRNALKFNFHLDDLKRESKIVVN